MDTSLCTASRSLASSVSTLGHCTKPSSKEFILISSYTTQS